MKVLWVTNTIFPELSKAIGNSAPVVGGWMYGLANDLVKHGVELIVVTTRPNTKEIKTKIEGITYILLKGSKPVTEYDSSLKPKWKHIINELNPNLVHIHGTEYAHGLSLIKACPDLNYITSIQGLISVCSKYYTGHLDYDEIKKYSTFRDFLKGDGIIARSKKFKQRGNAVEKEYFKLTRNFIGRTSWDYDHTITLNENARYYFCNESLRDAFYTSKKWNINSKLNYSIFLSQANYPIKGLHQVLKALPLLTKQFPSLKIRIAGSNILKNKTFKDKIALSGYANYLLHLINENNLTKHVEFTGYLNENQMINEYLNCNVFICPSSIENSPNSLGEAQLLGVPTIASYVGGIPDMVNHDVNGLLYRFEENEMLTQLIKRIFTEPDLALKLSSNGIKVATKRHDRVTNLKNTLKIYQTITK